MFFEFTPPDEGIMTCFGYEDVYHFLIDLRDGKGKCKVESSPANIPDDVFEKCKRLLPDTIVLIIDGVSYLISTADWDAPAAKAGLKRLWAKAPNERIWCKCKVLTWRGTHKHLHIEF